MIHVHEISVITNTAICKLYMDPVIVKIMRNFQTQSRLFPELNFY